MLICTKTYQTKHSGNDFWDSLVYHNICTYEGNRGYILGNEPPTTDVSRFIGVIIQNDGKIVTVGNNNDDASVVVSRFNINGSYDTSFGTSYLM